MTDQTNEIEMLAAEIRKCVSDLNKAISKSSKLNLHVSLEFLPAMHTEIGLPESTVMVSVSMYRVL